MNTDIRYKKLSTEMHNVHAWIDITCYKELIEKGNEWLKTSCFQSLSFHDYHFPIEGYTAIWLLSESHLAIHTFPNQARSYIQLTGCNQRKAKLFAQVLERERGVEEVHLFFHSSEKKV